MIVGREDTPPACFWELNNIGTTVFLVALAVGVNVKERIQKESLAGARVQKVCRVGPWFLCMYGRGEVRGAAIVQRWLSVWGVIVPDLWQQHLWFKVLGVTPTKKGDSFTRIPKYIRSCGASNDVNN